MKQQIIVFSGLPGSGKSAIAEGVAEELRITLLSVDPIESAVIQAGIAKSFETGLAAYLVAKVLAGEQLRLGNSVIIDAVNAEEEGKDIWRNLAINFDIPLTIIETNLDEAEHKRRIESRVRSLHGIPEVTWDRVVSRRKTYTQWEEPVLKLDSSHEIEANIELVLSYIQKAT